MTQINAGPGGAGAPAGGPPKVATFSVKPSEAPWTGEVKPDDKTMGMLCHLLGLLGIVGALIIWLIKRNESKFVDECGKEAVNFQLTVLMAYIVAWVTLVVFIGCILMPAVLIFDLVFLIIAAMKANNMIVYRYPLAIRFIK